MRKEKKKNSVSWFSIMIYVVIVGVIVGLAVFTKYGMPEIVAGSVVGVKGVVETAKDVAGVVSGKGQQE